MLNTSCTNFRSKLVFSSLSNIKRYYVRQSVTCLLKINWQALFLTRNRFHSEESMLCSYHLVYIIFLVFSSTSTRMYLKQVNVIAGALYGGENPVRSLRIMRWGIRSLMSSLGEINIYLILCAKGCSSNRIYLIAHMQAS